MAAPKPLGVVLALSTGDQIEASQAAAACRSTGASGVDGGSKLMSNQVAIWQDGAKQVSIRKRPDCRSPHRRTHAVEQRRALNQPVDRDREALEVLKRSRKR